MRRSVQLSILSGMYHQWDKNLREWLVTEIQKWSDSEQVLKKIWKVNFFDIISLLEGPGWDIRSEKFFKDLNTCRLIVNVYKHGFGAAFNELHKSNPEYLDAGGLSGILGPVPGSLIDYGDLEVKDHQIQLFSDSFVSFWNTIPEKILNTDELDAPEWFSSSLDKK